MQILERLLKNYSFLLKYYFWWKFLQNWTIFRVVRTWNPLPPKRVISWMLNWYEKLWKLLTWQPQMLYRWNLPRLYIFVWLTKNWGVTHKEKGGVKEKLSKISQKISFFLALLNFFHFLRLQEKHCHIWCIILICITGQKAAKSSLKQLFLLARKSWNV